MQIGESNEQLLGSKASRQGDLTDDNTPFEHRCALEHGHHFKEANIKARRACRKLILVSIVSFIFCGAEAVGGTISGSLAILCDAAH